MTDGVVDTTVLIHLFRGNLAAHRWIAGQQRLTITVVSWLEFMRGAPGKAGQKQSLRLMRQFSLEYLTQSDQRWAMLQMLRYRLSHGVSLTDCLIASVCYRLKVPLYTDNIKDFLPMLGGLVIKPY